MMKKLLVLALVLAVAGIANAGLSMTAAGSAVQLTSDDNGNYFVFLAFPGAEVVGTPTLFAPPAGPGSSIDDTSGVVEGFGRLIGVTMGGGVVSGSVVLNQPGLQFSVLTDKLYVPQGDVAVVMYADDLETVLGTLYTVPEPMTMVLLGLGGLFLRRKK